MLCRFTLKKSRTLAAEIIIETNEGILDLYQGAETSFYITRQIHDLHNFQTRNADFSKNIEVPPTANNVALLSVQQNTAGQQGIQCSIQMGGVMIAPVAFLFNVGTQGSNEADVLRIQILYGNFNFINQIEAGFISQINWADLAIDWEVADLITASQNTTDLVYAQADWGVRGSILVSNQTQDINLSGFFLYTEEILRRIIAETGFTMVLAANLPSDSSTL